MIAHINIGSNVGDRLAQIGKAVAEIERSFGRKATVSTPFRSAPWGYDSDAEYINIGVNVEVDDMNPIDVFERLMAIQSSLTSAPHRNAEGGYIDRELDIDLIAIDSLVVNTPSLTLPHPAMQLRRFVLQPMAEIHPRWIHPQFKLSTIQLLNNLTK